MISSENKELNQVMYDNYHEQCKRLKRALASDFNLEAMFIEYALMEDRSESVLRHADMWDAYVKSRKGREKTSIQKYGIS